MRWDKEKIAKGLIRLHRQWAATGKRDKGEFNYRFLREHDRALVSSIETKRFYRLLSEAFCDAGINPSCHKGQLDYGNTDSERRAKFKKVIKELSESRGIENLNDLSMNVSDGVPLPSVFRVEGTFLECEKANCKEIEVPLRSIYAQGRRLYGTWKEAVNATGIDYEKEVLRRVSSRSRKQYVSMFLGYLRENQDWKVKGLKEKNHPLYHGLYNSHQDSDLSGEIDDTILCAYLEARFLGQRKEQSLTKYCERNFERLRKDFYEKRLSQNVWNESRARPKGARPDLKRLKLELLRFYADGEGITRGALEDSKKRRARTVLGASRGSSKRRGGNHNTTLEGAGFLPKELATLYQDLSDEYTLERMAQTFRRLLGESLKAGENRLCREHSFHTDRDFHNAVIRKYGSWEKGLRRFGLDPKVFSMTASQRTKRGYAFQACFKEILERYGFREANPGDALDEKTFVSNKQIPRCRHKIKCRPDFLFEKFIIDTKTGYAAKQQDAQLERYRGHRETLWVVTLRGDLKTEVLKKGSVNFIGFSGFIEKSSEILGVALDPSEEQRLSDAFRNAEWDPFGQFK